MTRHKIAAGLFAVGLTLLLAPTPSAQRASPTGVLRRSVPGACLSLRAGVGEEERSHRLARVRRGRRNVYTAGAPAFRPVRLTRHLEDDGVDTSRI
jgi:hypothetical protein